MTTPPPFHRRNLKGENDFIQHVIPMIQDHFPGKWCSLNGAPADWEHGVDFLYIYGHQVQTISARVWNTMSHRNFTVRHYRTGAPERPLEYTTRMTAFKAGRYMTDWTVEAFIHKSGIEVGAIPTRKLFWHLDRMGDLAPRFLVQNQDDHTIFRKVSWIDVHEDMVRWFT